MNQKNTLSKINTRLRNMARGSFSPVPVGAVSSGSGGSEAAILRSRTVITNSATERSISAATETNRGK